jgi:uncharacterized membrane protein YagU involved in acid resistance
MNTRVLVATVAGGAAMFLFGFLIYGLLLDASVMKPNMNVYAGLMKDPPDWISLILANLVYSFLLALVFDKWASIRTASGGAVGGAILVFLITLTMQLFNMAFMNLAKNFTPAIADILGGTVLGALTGAAIGWALGFMSRETAPA